METHKTICTNYFHEFLIYSNILSLQIVYIYVIILLNERLDI